MTPQFQVSGCRFQARADASFTFVTKPTAEGEQDVDDNGGGSENGGGNGEGGENEE